MKATNNYILVAIDTVFENKIVGPEGKLNLDLMSFKENIVDVETDEVTYNSLEHKRNYGTVIAVPQALTPTINIYQEVIGSPEPLRHIDHEIVAKVGPMIKYECGLYEPKWKTAADIKMDVREGDKVYFHFNTLEEENRIQLPDGRKVYKLSYPNVICLVRHTQVYPNEIIPIAGKILIEPLYDEEVTDIEMEGYSVKGKLSKSGLIAELHNKPKFLEGIVRFISKPLKGDEITFKVGDRIIYQKHSDWPMTIEGKEYYVMRYTDIEAKIEEHAE